MKGEKMTAETRKRKKSKEIEYVEDITDRMQTMESKIKGLLKKTLELAILSGASVVLAMNDPDTGVLTLCSDKAFYDGQKSDIMSAFLGHGDHPKLEFILLQPDQIPPPKPLTESQAPKKTRSSLPRQNLQPNYSYVSTGNNCEPCCSPVFSNPTHVAQHGIYVSAPNPNSDAVGGQWTPSPYAQQPQLTVKQCFIKAQNSDGSSFEVLGNPHVASHGSYVVAPNIGFEDNHYAAGGQWTPASYAHHQKPFTDPVEARHGIYVSAALNPNWDDNLDAAGVPKTSYGYHPQFIANRCFNNEQGLPAANLSPQQHYLNYMLAKPYFPSSESSNTQAMGFYNDGKDTVPAQTEQGSGRDVAMFTLTDPNSEIDYSNAVDELFALPGEQLDEAKPMPHRNLDAAGSQQTSYGDNLNFVANQCFNSGQCLRTANPIPQHQEGGDVDVGGGDDLRDNGLIIESPVNDDQQVLVIRTPEEAPFAPESDNIGVRDGGNPSINNVAAGSLAVPEMMMQSTLLGMSALREVEEDEYLNNNGHIYNSLYLESFPQFPDSYF